LTPVATVVIASLHFPAAAGRCRASPPASTPPGCWSTSPPGGPDQGHDARLRAYEALASGAELIRTAGTEAVQLHGALGMTEEHDAQLFHRRAAVDALLRGRPTVLRRRAAALLADAYRTRG
jgi:alkylation response protein AidB-like acyl-CoA dehydrogenase